MNSPPLWSLPEDLVQIRDEDPDLIETILESFVEEMQKSLGELNACIAEGDGATADRALHKFKGALLQIGAPSVAAECQEFRTALTTENSTQWRVRQASIVNHCNRLLVEMGRTGQTR